MLPRVTTIMLAWGDEPVLEEAVRAVLASTGVDVDVVLVDNGCTSDAVTRLRPLAGVGVVTPAENLGFAGGCNEGARHATGEFLAFINGDAVVSPDALERLVAALDDTVGLVSGSLRLYDTPEIMNSAGNPIHYTGLSWAGGLGEPATSYDEPQEITGATGAATLCRADRFEALGGFCEPMFAYCEDAELSLRCWQRGWRVLYVPEAVVRHRYEFSRNDLKFYLLERNRLFLMLTLFEARTLLLIAVPMIGLELAVTALAFRDGWGKQKVAGWRWLIQNWSLVRRRRAQVQAERTRPDAALVPLLSADVTPGVDGLRVPGPARWAARMWWSLVRRAI